MGCDIHMYCEIKKDNIWTFSGPMFKDKYYNSEQETSTWNQPFTIHPYFGRNYRLFSVLADVRNGYGFAGIDTGDRIEPICLPKDLPPDMSEEVKKEWEGWESDGHSCSYLTVKELLDYNWNQTIVIRGMVTKETAEEYRKTGKTPDVWCGSTNQNGFENLEWKENLMEFTKGFVNETIPLLQTLGNPEDVRIVFWFDN